MQYDLVMKMLFNVIGGLGVFLIGMNYMREGLQQVAGPTFRKLINLMTSNRFFAVAVGVLVTCLVQSSSVTTVMVVGLVNSELMNLAQAIGVIMGANIGTTITGWILAIKVGKYGLPTIGVAAFFWLFSKRERARYTALAFLGIGMIFFGLELMKNGFKPIHAMPEFESAFHIFEVTNYWSVLKAASVGCILTLIVQSSSATLGITIGLASTGVISFESAAALVLGENIGTTITAYLASVGAGIVAKRTAYFHFMFNVLGVFWITLVFNWYLPIIETILGVDPNQKVMAGEDITYPYITAAIAAVHSGFNVTNTLIFLPFTTLFAKLLSKIGADRPKTEESYLTKLDFKVFNSPFVAIEQSSHELSKMGDSLKIMLRNLRKVIEKRGADEEIINNLFMREDILDQVQMEITTFLTDMLSEKISSQLAQDAQIQLRLADEYESISDYVTAIMKLFLRLQKNSVALTAQQQEEILGIHDAVDEYCRYVLGPIQMSMKGYLISSKRMSYEINQSIRVLRARHWNRLSEDKIDPLISTTYMDISNSYRRMKDHLLNAAETVAGMKILK